MNNTNQTEAAPETLDRRMANLRSKVSAAKSHWRAESRLWIAEQAAKYVADRHADATENPHVTAGQVVAHLDKLDPPVGYVYMMDNYPARYQFVRRVLQELVDTGKLKADTTVNSRNRPAASFSPAGWSAAPVAVRAPFEVVVDAATPQLAKDLQAQLMGFLSANKLEGVHGLLVTRIEEPEPVAPVKRRRVARGTGGSVG